MKQKTTVINVLKSPVLILIAIIMAVYTGLNYPLLSHNLSRIGNIYINILKLFALPIFITAVISGSVNLAKYPKFRSILGKMVFLILFFALISSGLGIVAGIVGFPGVDITSETKSILNNNFGDTNIEIVEVDFIGKASGIISDNIFYSLFTGNLLQIFFFSILIGLSIGLIKNSKSDFLYDMFDGLFFASQKVITWLSVLMPFGLYSIFSGIVSKINMENIEIMAKFIYLYYALGVLIILAGLVIIWRRSGQRFPLVLSKIAKPSLIALSTGNTLAVLPYSIFAMNRDLKFDKETTNMYLPFGHAIARYGNIIFYSLTSVFITQIYGIKLDVLSILIILLTSILAGFLSAGTSGIAAISMISVTLSYFGIPLESVIVTLLVVDIVIEPMRALLTVFINLVSTSLLGKSNSYKAPECELGVIMQNMPDNIDLRTYFKDLDQEIPLIGQDKTELLIAVFPNATFRKYKNWDGIKELWENYDINIAIGEKDHVKNISLENGDESKFVVLKPRI